MPKVAPFSFFHRVSLSVCACVFVGGVGVFFFFIFLIRLAFILKSGAKVYVVYVRPYLCCVALSLYIL